MKKFTAKHFAQIKSRDDLIALAERENIDISATITKLQYEAELYCLQYELVNLQNWIAKNKMRVAIIFEGRDAAGKGGTIKRFKEHLNPRSFRVVALNKPTEVERGQWYFRRYVKVLPNAGEMVFFDRSWYNRAVVEPVMGFCTDDQYNEFMTQVPGFEHLLYEDDVKIIKLWFNISKEEQKARFDSRLHNPLKRWKYSPVDEKGQKLWDKYTYYRDQMMSKTHTNFCPWVTVNANNKKIARVESIRYVLSQFDYDGKGESGIELLPDPNIVSRYYRSKVNVDI